MKTNSGADDHSLNPQEKNRLKRTGLIVLIVAVVVVAVGIISRARSAAATQQWTTAQAIPTVSTLTPVDATTGDSVVLPGNLQAYAEAPIYARVNGYLKHWYQDIGAHVKAGQLLADIDAPDLDQQLIQAKADLASASSNADLARVTAKRWQNLLQSDAVSAQESDEKSGDLAAKRSAVAAARANVERLQALASFKRITSPFDGVVTARNTDVGALISAGNSTGPVLFSVADVHKLRVYVNVPQNQQASIVPGMTATLTVPEHPGQHYQATLAGTAHAISQNSGTVLVQFEVDNQDNSLTPGDYAEVNLSLPSSAQGLRVPASALIFRQQGLQLAVLGAGNHVLMRHVSIARDNGVDVDIASGLQAGDQVIDSPPDSLEQGDLVHPIKPVLAISSPVTNPGAGNE